MPTTLFWLVMLASAIFGFVVIGGAARWAFGDNTEGGSSASTPNRQSKGAQEER